MQNYHIHKSSFDNFRPSNGCNSALKKSKWCRGHLFSNAVNIMIFISDVQSYMSVKLWKTARSIHLFKISGTLQPGNIKLNWNYLCDTLEIYWKEVSVTFNDNRINLPKIVKVRLRNKLKLRCMMKKEPILINMMFKQGITWYTLASHRQETV